MLPEIWSEISNKFLFAVKSTIFYFFEVVLEISSAIVAVRQCWMLQMRIDMEVWVRGLNDFVIKI